MARKKASTPPGVPSADEVLEELLEREPELRRLQQLALRLKDTKEAKAAASELLRRATDIQDYLGPVLMDRPDLFEDEAPIRLTMPVTIALGRAHRYHHARVVKQLRELKLGSKTGISCEPRSNWKPEGEVGAWAVDLYNVIVELRGRTRQQNHVIRSYALLIRRHHPEIVDAACDLQPFGGKTVAQWIPVARRLLDVLRPDLQRVRQGRRKLSDTTRSSHSAKAKRNAIMARIREMAAAADKGHTWVKKAR